MTTFSPRPSTVSADRLPRLGLVLGAGGVRGCAHAGAVSVLHEAGIRPDLVVGASVGAIFGLAVAAGVTAERMAQVIHDSGQLDLVRFYFAGRLRTDRRNPIARLVAEAGDGKTFADLPLPFAVLATDMETGEPTVLDSGPVLPAVEASIALPFIARPVELGGRFYVDGGLLDTAPVRVARKMGAGWVIAICLGNNYSAPRLFRKRPWTRQILERLGEAGELTAARFRDQVRFSCRLCAATFDPPLPAQDADIAIWPEFGRIGPNSMVGSRFCYEQGVKATWQAMPDIVAMASEGRRSTEVYR
ncbi:MAG TPA: patatin-like phospholipase family protein [Chloroflexota bacterium]